MSQQFKRIPAPSTDRVVFRNGVWVIFDYVRGFAHGPFSLKKEADAALAAGKSVPVRGAA